MRHMYLLAGAPACGKSTFVNDFILKHRLGRVISWDAYRNVFRDPYGDGSRNLHTIDGWEVAPLTRREENYAIRRSLADTEMFMQAGDTIFVDNTNTKKKNVMPFIELADAYGYRVWLIDMQGKQPLDTLIRRNYNRTGYKRVPKSVVEDHYKAHMTTRANFEELFSEYYHVMGFLPRESLVTNMAVPTNFSRASIDRHLAHTDAINLANIYKRVALIGDVQGMGNTLEKAIAAIDPKGLASGETLWIFMGDLFDRGNNPVKVANLVFPYLLGKAPNVKLINGNHESILLNVMAGVLQNKEAEDTLAALMKAGYTKQTIRKALWAAVPAAELRLDSILEDGTVGSQYLYLSHAGVHPKLFADASAPKNEYAVEKIYGVYRHPMKTWETGYSQYERARLGYSSYEHWAPALNELYVRETEKFHAGASDRRVTARSRVDDSLVAVCGHRGGYGNPKQYSNLVPLESQVEYKGGRLSVMVYTATLAAWADEDDVFRHVWQGERREFASDSNLVNTRKVQQVLPPE